MSSTRCWRASRFWRSLSPSRAVCPRPAVSLTLLSRSTHPASLRPVTPKLAEQSSPAQKSQSHIFSTTLAAEFPIAPARLQRQLPRRKLRDLPPSPRRQPRRLQPPRQHLRRRHQRHRHWPPNTRHSANCLDRRSCPLRRSECQGKPSDSPASRVYASRRSSRASFVKTAIIPSTESCSLIRALRLVMRDPSNPNALKNRAAPGADADVEFLALDVFGIQLNRELAGFNGECAHEVGRREDCLEAGHGEDNRRRPREPLREFPTESSLASCLLGPLSRAYEGHYPANPTDQLGGGRAGHAGIVAEGAGRVDVRVERVTGSSLDSS